MAHEPVSFIVMTIPFSSSSHVSLFRCLVKDCADVSRIILSKLCIGSVMPDSIVVLCSHLQRFTTIATGALQTCPSEVFRSPRAKDPHPGNIVIWRGLSRLTDIAIGFQIAKDVGN